MQEIHIKTTKEQELIDIRKQIEIILEKSKVKSGLLQIYTPHATCSIIINENYDPNVCSDILNFLSKLIPDGIWLHDKIDNNASAHIKSTLLGPSQTIPIKGSKLQLGTWQSPMFCEFDGPKERTILINIIKG